MKVPIASDHAGFKAKENVKQLLISLGIEVDDLGTHSEDSVDYPDYAVLVAKRVASGESERGVLICGSGQGMCMTANKIQGVRAALVWSEEIARLSVQHNHANILCIPGRYLSDDELQAVVKAWFSAEFEGGRHANRINKMGTLTC